MSTPSMVEAEARLDEAKRAATTATANVATTRERVAVHEASDGDLKRAIRAEQKAVDAVATAEAGVRVARRIERAQETENRAILERIKAEQTRQVQLAFAKTSKEVTAFMTEVENKLAAFSAVYDNLKPSMNAGGLWPTRHSAWIAVLRNVAELKEWFAFEQVKRQALGYHDDETPKQ